MALFFFVVGLEIKRELVAGELNDARKGDDPSGRRHRRDGCSALLYFMFNASGPGAAGWGITGENSRE